MALPAFKLKKQFETLFLNGFTEELVSVIPPGAALTTSSTIDEHNKGKAPGRKLTTGEWSGGWSYAKDVQNAQRMDQWGGNIGLETSRLIPIDLDVNDPALHKPLIALARKMFGASMPVRMGRRPLLFGRLSGPCTIGRLSSVFHSKGKPEDTHKIETFFGPHKQFVLHGTHPSGVAYTCDPPLEKLKYEMLPELTEPQIRQFMQEAQYLLQDKYGYQLVSTVKDGPGPERNERPDPARIIAPIPFVAKALHKIPNTKGRDRWVDICHAVKGATQDNPVAGRKLWIEWCESRADGDPHLTEAKRVWDSAGRQDGGLWIGYEALLTLGGLHEELARHEFAQTPADTDNLPGTEPPTLFKVQPVCERPLSRPSWIIRNILPRGACLGVMYGQPGSNKSTLVTTMAVHIAVGMRFCGLPVREGNVLLISEEDAVVNRRRITAWEHTLAEHEEEWDLPEDWREKLKTRILETYPGFGHISRRKVKHLADEVLRMTSGEGVQVVFVDTLARTFIHEGEENEAADMNKYIDLAEGMSEALSCPVVVLHHPPKNADTLRGHGSLLGAVSLVWKVERTEGDGLVRLYCQKMREAPEFKPLAFSRHAVDISFAVQRADEEDDAEETALVLKHTEWTEVSGRASSQDDAGEGATGRPQRVTDMDIMRVLCLHPGMSMRGLSATLGFANSSTLRYRFKRMEEFGMVCKEGTSYVATEAGLETFVKEHPEGALA